MNGYNVHCADYGWFGLLSVRLFNRRVSKKIVESITNHSTGIGHSNGCTILVEACKRGAMIDNLILINPALDRDTIFPDNIKNIIVYHNIFDSAVRISRWLPWHPWGDMGRVGYRGNDKRVVNVETSEIYEIRGHSTIFLKPKELWDDIIKRIGCQPLKGQ